MFELMYEHEGVGLAANQVDLPYRLFVANAEGERDAKEAEYVFINPVLSGGRGQEEDEEGCLSIPGIRAPGHAQRRRSRSKPTTWPATRSAAKLEGLMARILQHETDHLDGTLFIDRLGPTQLAAIPRQAGRIRARVPKQTRNRRTARRRTNGQPPRANCERLRT